MERKTWSIFLVVLLIAGCHARFKKFAKKADAVGVDVEVTTTPVVHFVGGPMAKMGVAANASKTQKRLEKLMPPEEVQKSFQAGAVDTLGEGRPFSANGTDVDGTISVNVTYYGMYRSDAGPVFAADLEVVGKNSSGEEVYSNEVRCEDSTWMNTQGMAQVAGTSGAIPQIQKMSDEEIKKKIDYVVRRCSQRMITKLRKHAS